MSPRPPAGSGLLGFSGARGETGVHAWEGREKALKKLKFFCRFHEKGIAK